MSPVTKVWDYKSGKVDKLAGQVQKDKNIVMTKPSMAKYLIGHIGLLPGETVMEPCRGDGAFYDNLPEPKVWCEINEGVDYLAFDGMVDCTISNPPFVPRSLFMDFHRKAMETTRRKIYWLINIVSMNVFTPKRLKEMNEKKWFIQSFHVVQDNRWFGRYVLIELGKEDRGVFTCGQSF